ncbi:MAG: cell division protein FtsQ/DivIB [Pseudobdellovibrio sp.]
MNLSKFKVYIKLFLVLIVLPAGVFGSFYVLDQNGFFNIKTISMSVVAKEDQKVFSKPYLDKLNEQLSEYKGQSLWRFSLSQVSNKLKMQRWIRDFRISRSWPSELIIEIEPYVLSYLYADANQLAKGVVVPVTVDGEMLAPVETSQAPGLALLKGDVFVKDKEKRQKAIELLKSLPEEGKLSHKIISEVGFDKKEGYWVSVIENDVKIKLGDDQFAVKSSRVSQVLDYLEKRDLKARVIDANLSKKVLVRLQQTP